MKEISFQTIGKALSGNLHPPKGQNERTSRGVLVFHVGLYFRPPEGRVCMGNGSDRSLLCEAVAARLRQ